MVGWRSNNVVVISPDDRSHKVLLSDRDGVNMPFRVHCDRASNQLCLINERCYFALLYDISTTPTWHYCVRQVSCVITYVLYLSYYFNVVYFLFFQDKTIMSRNRHLKYKTNCVDAHRFSECHGNLKLYGMMVSVQLHVTTTSVINMDDG